MDGGRVLAGEPNLGASMGADGAGEVGLRRTPSPWRRVRRRLTTWDWGRRTVVRARLDSSWAGGREVFPEMVFPSLLGDSLSPGPAVGPASNQIGTTSGMDVGIRRRTRSEPVPRMDEGGARGWDGPVPPNRTAGTRREECSIWNFARGPLHRATCTIPLGANLVCHRGDVSRSF